MPNPNTAAERLQSIVSQLTTREPAPPPPNRVSVHLNDGVSPARYLGLGREMPSERFGLYAHGIVNSEAWLTHDLQFDFLSLDPTKSPFDKKNVRQKIGHISLARSGDDLVNVSTSGFDTQEGDSKIPVETLVAPLGEWATAAVANDIAVRAVVKTVQPVPVEVTADQLESIGDFLNDPTSVHAYFRLEYDASGPVGLITAQA